MDYSEFEELLFRDEEFEGFSMNSHRLDMTPQDLSNREVVAINFIGKTDGGGQSLEDKLINTILHCYNPESAPEGKKELAKALKENEELLKVVLRTTFQWFGTNIGRGYLFELHDLIRNYDNALQEASDKRSQLEMDIRNLEFQKGKLEKDLAEMS